MDRFDEKRIPDHIPERIVHPIRKALIGKNSWDKHNRINKVGEEASHTHFPCLGFAIEECKVPEKMFVRAHGICLIKCRYRPIALPLTSGEV